MPTTRPRRARLPGLLTPVLLASFALFASTLVATPPLASGRALAATGATASRAGAPSGVNPCSLLTNKEVARIAPGHRPGRVDNVAGVTKICNWDNAKGIPQVTLHVLPPERGGPVAALRASAGELGKGYKIVRLRRAGWKAAALVAKAMPERGISSGVSEVVAQQGGKMMAELGVPGLQVKRGTRRFSKLERLAETAAHRLKG